MKQVLLILNVLKKIYYVHQPIHFNFASRK